MDNRKRKLNLHVQQQNYVNDHLYRKTGPILHQFDQSRDIGKKAKLISMIADGSVLFLSRRTF